MKTLEEIKEELLAENPSRIYVVNDEEFEQSDEEFDKAIENKAKMLLVQQDYEIAKEAERQAKISAYHKLGLTEAEIEALLPTPKPADNLKEPGLS